MKTDSGLTYLQTYRLPSCKVCDSSHDANNLSDYNHDQTVFSYNIDNMEVKYLIEILYQLVKESE